MLDFERKGKIDDRSVKRFFTVCDIGMAVSALYFEVLPKAKL
jgi:hypothetical protein